MENIRLACFGESKNNLEMSIKYGILGFTRNYAFKKGDLFYYAVKINSVWNICGRGRIVEPTDLNPFDEPGKHYGTFLVESVEACTPFQINELCRDLYGQYWGLIFQKPTLISDEAFIEKVEKSFEKIDTARMLELV